MTYASTGAQLMTQALRLPVLYHSAGYIFISFGIIGSIVVSLQKEFCLCIR